LIISNYSGPLAKRQATHVIYSHAGQPTLTHSPENPDDELKRLRERVCAGNSCAVCMDMSASYQAGVWASALGRNHLRWVSRHSAHQQGSWRSASPRSQKGSGAAAYTLYLAPGQARLEDPEDVTQALPQCSERGAGRAAPRQMVQLGATLLPGAD